MTMITTIRAGLFAGAAGVAMLTMPAQAQQSGQPDEDADGGQADEDTDREHGVRRVWAAVDGAGRLGAVEVERRADSAIYAETSRVRVDLRPTPEGWLPRRVLTDTRTDVPLSAPTRVRAEWTVRAQPGA